MYQWASTLVPELTFCTSSREWLAWWSAHESNVGTSTVLALAHDQLACDFVYISQMDHVWMFLCHKVS